MTERQLMNVNTLGSGSKIWPVWLFLLVAIYPVPHTIALRNLLLLIGLLGLAWHWRATFQALTTLWRRSTWLTASAWLLVALTVWMVIHALLIAPLPTMALDRVRVDWLMPLLLLATGATVAIRSRNGDALRGLVIALALHIVLVAIFQCWQWLTLGHWPFGVMPFAERDYHSTLNGFLIALLLADRLSLLIAGTAPLNFSAGPAWGLLISALGADVLLRARNGTVVCIVLLIVAVAILLADSRCRKRWGLRIALVVGFAVLLGGMSVRNDVRWQGFSESMVIGIESNNLFWMTGDPNQLPFTPSGNPLEQSAYARAAWARQAVEAIARKPLGIGYGHDAFGRAIAEKYGHAGMGSSHSGWLDIALGIGVPGLALVIALGVVTVAAGWRRFRCLGDGYSLLLALTVSGYFLRCLLDGHFSGWRLALFTLIVGLLIGASAKMKEGK
ncbi:O-antigen ligase family protein [Sulfuritalea sp.]|uniref:O-antigen ligase family protein n=1 Tax=Sulfuritalea sp. TaxID=2480090 RepID=UPI00286E00EE|nr:O-antigen ligase family protein [Sulfuritalea sp.]